MPRVYVSIGSNVRPEENVRAAIRLLREKFGELEISPVYQTAAVGFEGDDFLNLVVAFESNEPAQTVDTVLDEIERHCGRETGSPRFAPRTLDLDLLLYGEQILDFPGLRLPRPEILKYAFVLAPLADIAYHNKHPETGRSFGEMWRAFADDGHRIEAVPFELD